MIGKKFWAVASVIYIAAVSYLCFASFDNGPQVDFTLFGLKTDKIVHFLMFLPSPILFFKALFTDEKLRMALPVALGCILMALATELIQKTLPTRAMEISDLIADSIGILVGTLVLSIAAHKKPGSSL